MATSNLQQEIGRLRTLQESYDVIADNLGLFTEGKTDLASAITAKGVETAPTDSLATMADKVREIVIAPLQVESGEYYSLNMYGKNMWDIWNVAKEVWNKYSGIYRGFIVAQYYKGYASINLSGADGYLTSDGYYYTSAQAHIWHDENDGMIDRYVVFLYLSDGYTFSSATNGLCPREIIVVGECSGISVNYNRLTQLWVNQTLPSIQTPSSLGFIQIGNDTPSGNWNAVQFIAGYKHHVDGNLFQASASLLFVLIPELETISAGALIYNDCSSLNAISLPNLREISGGAVINALSGVSSLNAISLPNLREISGGAVIKQYRSGAYSGTLLDSVQYIDLPKLEVISGDAVLFMAEGQSSHFLNACKSINLPALREIQSGYIFRCNQTYIDNSDWLKALEHLYLPSLTKVAAGGIMGNVKSDTPAFTSLSLPALTTISGGSLLSSSSGTSNFTAFTSLSLPALTTISGGSLLSSSGTNHFPAFTSLSLPAIELINSSFLGPGDYELSYIYIGYSTNDRTKTVNVNLINATAPLLTDIELKDGYCKNLTCSSYTALTAENIVAHILNRLGVNQAYLDEPTNANKLTITLGATNLAKLTDEEKQIAIDKGFTLA